MFEDHLLNIVKEFNNLEKHDATYADSEHLVRRAISNKILEESAFEIAKNCKYDGYQGALGSMVYKLFYKKTESGMNVNEQLDEELHKPVTKIFKRRKVYTSIKQYLGSRSS